MKIVCLDIRNVKKKQMKTQHQNWNYSTAQFHSTHFVSESYV